MIGDRLQWLRKRQKLTQAQFAEATEVSGTAYKNYEKGLTEPSVTLLKKISEQFEVDFTWIATGRGSPDPEGLLEAIEEAVRLVDALCETLPVKAPSDKKGQIVKLLIRQWLESGIVSDETAKFLLAGAA